MVHLLDALGVEVTAPAVLLPEETDVPVAEAVGITPCLSEVWR